jgi:hypothetical protein
MSAWAGTAGVRRGDPPASRFRFSCTGGQGNQQRSRLLSSGGFASLLHLSGSNASTLAQARFPAGLVVPRERVRRQLSAPRHITASPYFDLAAPTRTDPTHDCRPRVSTGSCRWRPTRSGGLSGAAHATMFAVSWRGVRVGRVAVVRVALRHRRRVPGAAVRPDHRRRGASRRGGGGGGLPR